MIRRGLLSTLAVTMLMLPLLSVISYEMGFEFSPNASAALNCNAATDTIVTNPEEVHLIEDFELTNSGYLGEDDAWGERDEDDRNEITYAELCSLSTSFSTSFVLKNDSAIGARMKLTTGWKYTISVDVQPLNNSDVEPVVDVYLMQEDDFNQYKWDFDSRHNDWDGMRDDIAHSSPWLQTLIIWQPFRDVHAYEKLDQVDFSVALDHEEQSYSIWDNDAQQRTMFLMIESWNNIRDYDAPSQKSNYSVDLTVNVEERTTLPNWTVKCCCCGGLLGFIASPFLIHNRYMKAGISDMDVSGGDMMVHLDTSPEKAQEDIVPSNPPTQ
ncbi:MAG: hypothetical protein QF454_01965 [Candidatus Thalassarchaeaceae archaeon]|nr:hypothetical protein [Candidatus Thalassarchaeaceae archaeon]